MTSAERGARNAEWGTLAALATMILLSPSITQAHSLSRSHSRWVVDGTTVRVTVTVPILELARGDRRALGQASAALLARTWPRRWAKAEVMKRLRLTDAAARCKVASGPWLGAAGVRKLTIGWTLRCERPPRPAVACDLFFARAPSHLHFLKLRQGVTDHEAVLTADRSRVDFSAPGATGERPGGGLLAFLAMGFHHVLIGYDHVAFVIGLMLLGGRLWTLIKIATGFTMGHSVTLFLAAMGLVRPLESSVEILVGLSILYVALEYFHHHARPPARRVIFGINLAAHGLLLTLALVGRTLLPWPVAVGSALFTSCHLTLQQRQGATAAVRAAVAVLFGLVHGLAFAGALGEAFEGASLLAPLLGFNLGVEAGQAAVILAVVPLLWLVKRRLGDAAHAWVTGGAAAAVLALGIGWTFTRALGG